MKTKLLQHRARHVRASGFSLIELMIAMVLGLLVLGAAIAVFQSNQRTYRANEGLNRIQENARVAFELMSRDLRAAGGSACSNASVVETSDTPTDNEKLYRDTPVSGTATEVTITSGDDTAYKVTASSATSVTISLPTGMTSAADAFKADDLLLLCNARKTFVVKATAVGTNTITFAALPGNYSPSSDEYAPPAAVVVAKLRSTRWYVDGTTLKVSRLGGAGEAVAEGVQSLALSYLETGDSAYKATPTNATNIIAVRTTLALVGRSATGNQLSVDGNTITRTASNVVSLRSRTL